MPAPLRLRLDQRTRDAVAGRYERACGLIERTNAHMVLLADEGRSVAEIAWLVRRGRDQVGTILHRFRNEDLGRLVSQRLPDACWQNGQERHAHTASASVAPDHAVPPTAPSVRRPQ